jgi:hypothetical protein
MFKQISITLVGIAWVLVGCSAPHQEPIHSKESPPHSLGIYLVNFNPQRPWTPETLGKLADLALVKEPVLSDTDILSYDFATHRFHVRQPALARLPSPPVWHTPFVLMADGQRIYVGAFSTSLSSYSLSVPSIRVDFRDFSNELSIDRAYPTGGFGTGTDPRSDERIRSALAGLHKLK